MIGFKHPDDLPKPVCRRTIRKYQLETVAEQILKLPKSRVLRHFGAQYLTPCAWFEVDPQSELEDVRIVMFGTGSRIPEDPPFMERGTYYTYLGTRQSRGDFAELVRHFYIKEELQ